MAKTSKATSSMSTAASRPASSSITRSYPGTVSAGYGGTEPDGDCTQRGQATKR
jgi:hypothetical protein